MVACSLCNAPRAERRARIPDLGSRRRASTGKCADRYASSGAHRYFQRAAITTLASGAVQTAMPLAVPTAISRERRVPPLLWSGADRYASSGANRYASTAADCNFHIERRFPPERRWPFPSLHHRNVGT